MNKVKFYLGNDPYKNNLEIVENTLFHSNPISIKISKENSNKENSNSKENNNLFKDQINFNKGDNCYKLLLNKVKYYLFLCL